jgi:hypothetical protein
MIFATKGFCWSALSSDRNGKVTISRVQAFELIARRETIRLPVDTLCGSCHRFKIEQEIDTGGPQCGKFPNPCQLRLYSPDEGLIVGTRPSKENFASSIGGIHEGKKFSNFCPRRLPLRPGILVLSNRWMISRVPTLLLAAWLVWQLMRVGNSRAQLWKSRSGLGGQV